MDIAVLGIDLGKTTCSVAGLDNDGTVVLRKRIQTLIMNEEMFDSLWGQNTAYPWAAGHHS